MLCYTGVTRYAIKTDCLMTLKYANVLRRIHVHQERFFVQPNQEWEIEWESRRSQDQQCCRLSGKNQFCLLNLVMIHSNGGTRFQRHKKLEFYHVTWSVRDVRMTSQHAGRSRRRLEVGNSFESVEAAPPVGHVEGLEDVGEGSVVATHSFDRRLQTQKAFFLKT